MSSRTVTSLHGDWQFKEHTESDRSWLPVAQFPTNIHLDLLAHGKIPEPFYGQNENDVQWVGERDWDYQTSFTSPAVPKGSKVILNFDGLDTYASVKLNGDAILKTDNMFHGYRADVTGRLNSEGEKNTLEITFESAFLRGKKIEEEHPDHKFGCWNGDKSRLAVRKAQYHYGWDWGPTLLTAGPWRAVTLEVFESRISDLYFHVDVPESLKDVVVQAKADIEGSAKKVEFKLELDGKEVATATAGVSDGLASADIKVEKPELWFPVGYGKQPIYKLSAVLLDGDSKTVDSASKTLGIRRSRVVQRDLTDQPGKTFFFEINNVPIFCGGSNWIPADSFTPGITDEKYRDWLQLLVDGNQNMVRVWGGGIYEEQVFYNVCDELGILVWQDFAFGCGNYPAFPSFLESVKEEATYNVKRLRHHPSIVIYAGNNEDYQFQESENLDYDADDTDPENWLKGSFPARYIYEKILKDVCDKQIPGTYYHFGSPIGGKGVGNKTTTDPTMGDLHQWNVWHQQQRPYQEFDLLAGRFVSEFGMEAFPSIKTIESYVSRDSSEFYSQSSTVDFHNKADGHARRIALYLVENIRYSLEPLPAYIYATQLMQAECLSTAYRLWRRNWKGEGREYTSGALVWQINDCWPVTSWAIVDYYLRPKTSFFAIKREMNSLVVASKRSVKEVKKDKYTRVDIVRTPQVEIWSSSFKTTETKDLTLVIKSFEASSGKQLKEEKLQSFTQPPNAALELATLNIADYSNGIAHSQVIFALYLVDSTGKTVARYIDWPQPLKFVYTKPKISDVSVKVEGDSVKIAAKVPVKGVVLELKDGDNDEVRWEDQGVDLVPGEEVVVRGGGLAGREVAVTWYEKSE